MNLIFKDRKGKNNSNYKDGRTNNTKCSKCNEQLINYQAKNHLCRKCWIKSRIGYKHNKKTIAKMKLAWLLLRKFIFIKCKQCNKEFKIISWKSFRKFCSLKCSSTFRKGIKRPKHSKSMIKVLNPNWHGGISKLPYSFEFTEQLKKRIRNRDNYKCKLCNKIKKLFIHHIDYNKQNCKENNLISLCKKCHSKTNGNRDYWYAYFSYLLKND